MSDSYQITVMGRRFNLKGAHDPEHIARVERYINERIDEVKAAGGPVDTTNLMILVALNLTDDLLKSRDDLERMQDTIYDNAQMLINLIESHI